VLMRDFGSIFDLLATAVRRCRYDACAELGLHT
jgi:hypothetical protein